MDTLVQHQVNGGIIVVFSLIPTTTMEDHMGLLDLVAHGTVYNLSRWKYVHQNMKFSEITEVQ